MSKEFPIPCNKCGFAFEDRDIDSGEHICNEERKTMNEETDCHNCGKGDCVSCGLEE